VVVASSRKYQDNLAIRVYMALERIVYEVFIIALVNNSINLRHWELGQKEETSLSFISQFVAVHYGPMNL